MAFLLSKDFTPGKKNSSKDLLLLARVDTLINFSIFFPSPIFYGEWNIWSWLIGLSGCLSGSKNGFRFKQNGLDGRGSCQSLETSNFRMLFFFFWGGGGGLSFFLSFFRDPKQTNKQTIRAYLFLLHIDLIFTLPFLLHSLLLLLLLLMLIFVYVAVCFLLPSQLASAFLPRRQSIIFSIYFFNHFFFFLIGCSQLLFLFQFLLLFLSSCSSPPLVPSSLFFLPFLFFLSLINFRALSVCCTRKVSSLKIFACFVLCNKISGFLFVCFLTFCVLLS